MLTYNFAKGCQYLITCQFTHAFLIPPFLCHVALTFKSECLAASVHSRFPQQGHTVNIWFITVCTKDLHRCTFPLCTMNLSLCLTAVGELLKGAHWHSMISYKWHCPKSRKTDHFCFWGSWFFRVNSGTILKESTSICWKDEVIVCG